MKSSVCVAVDNCSTRKHADFRGDNKPQVPLNKFDQTVQIPQLKNQMSSLKSLNVMLTFQRLASMFYGRYCRREMRDAQNYPVVHFLLCCGCQADWPSLLRPLRCVQSKGVLGFVQHFNYDGHFIQEHVDVLRQEKKNPVTKANLPQSQHFCTSGLQTRRSCQGQQRINSWHRGNGTHFPALPYPWFLLPAGINTAWEDLFC